MYSWTIESNTCVVHISKKLSTLLHKIQLP